MANYYSEVGRERCSIIRWVFSLRLKVVKDQRSFHHRGASQQLWHGIAGAMRGRHQASSGSGTERFGRCVGSEELLDACWFLASLVCKHQCFKFDARHNRQQWRSVSRGVAWEWHWTPDKQMPEGQPVESCSSPGETVPLLGQGAGLSRSYTCIPRSLQCSRRRTVCYTPRFFALGDEVTVVSPREI